MISRAKRKSIKALLLTSSLGTFIFGLFTPFYAIYVEKFGGSVQLAGTSWAVFSIVSGVLILALSSVEATYRSKKDLYVLGIFLRGLAFLLYIFIQSFFQLILLQILLGISVALVNPSFDALFTNQTTEEDALKDWGGWEGFVAIAAGAAALLGGYFIDVFGFEYIFLGMAALSFLICIYLVCLPKDLLK